MGKSDIVTKALRYTYLENRVRCDSVVTIDAQNVTTKAGLIHLIGKRIKEVLSEFVPEKDHKTKERGKIYSKQ